MTGVQTCALPICGDLLRRLKADGITQVVIGGGEPCEWPGDWRWAAQTAHRQGFLVQLGTNGAPLPEGFECEQAVDRFVLPLDGASASIHNRLRPMAPLSKRWARQDPAWLDKPGPRSGHFAIIIDRLETLRRARREVTLSTVITAENIAEIPALAALVTQYVAAGGCLHAWHLYRFIPEGRGGRAHQERLAVGAGAYDAAVALARRSAPEISIYRRPDMRHSKTVDFYWYSRGALCIGSRIWEKQEEAAASVSSPSGDRSSAASG